MPDDMDRILDAIEHTRRTAEQVRTSLGNVDERIQGNISQISASLGRKVSTGVTGHRILDPLTISLFASRRCRQLMDGAVQDLIHAIESLS